MEGAKGNAGFDMVLDDNGMVLTLIKFAKGMEREYPYTFHIGFIQESEEQVNEINQRLKADGYEVDTPARMHGSWTFYFLCPGGFTIEVLA
jgi:catechol-2,3-dioxygenase